MDKLTSTMMMQAHKALSNAYAPYSKFTVASCICTENHQLFTGVNVENASYGLSICAESSAICSMISSGERLIKSMVVLAGTNLLCSPCGACRQKIREFSTDQTLVHLCNKESVFKTMTITELLPLAFNFKP